MDISVVTTLPRSVKDLNLKLGNLFDDILSEIGADQMRTLIMDARDIRFPATSSFSVSY